MFHVIHIIFLAWIFLLETDCQPLVNTTYGQVQGKTITTHYDGISVNSFHGIPFAKPPVGDLRFQKPENADPYDGIFVADELPTACVQTRRGWLWITHPGWNNYGEDCLYLDVFTPENMSPEEKYAVMVFFHGGAYQSGASIQYPGHYYAARDVIMVVPHYRMGIFGFVSTNDAVAPGNYGLYDQRQALQWVQANIANFGGDPNRVTIFGQSAGAGSVGHHMISPQSQGLFSQVIEQSGSDIHFWAINWPASEPHTYGQRVAEELECPIDTTEEWIDCLKEQDPWVLLNISKPIECTPGHFCLGFAPVVDGNAPIVDPFIPDIPLEMRKRGEYVKVPVMTGYLRDDGALYVLDFIPEAMEGGFTREEFQYYLRENLLGMWTPQLTEKENEDAFQALDWFYAPWPYINDTEMNRDAMTLMTTDGAFGAPSDRLARFHSEDNSDFPVYEYVFAYRSNDSYDGILEDTAWMKVFHSAELPYVFGWPLLQLSDDVRDDTGIIDIVPWNQDDIDYGEFVIDLWANYAKFSNPTPQPVLNPPFDNAPVRWNTYNSSSGNYNLFFMGEEIDNAPDYGQKGNAMWREYMTYLLNRDFFMTSNDQRPSSSPSMKAPDHFETAIGEEKLQQWLVSAFPGEYDHLFD